MATSAQRALVGLKDSQLTTSDRAEDMRSRKVVDAAGEEIGYRRSRIPTLLDRRVQLSNVSFLSLAKEITRRSARRGLRGGHEQQATLTGSQQTQRGLRRCARREQYAR